MLGFIRRHKETIALLYIVFAVVAVALFGHLLGDAFAFEASGFFVGWQVGIIFALVSLAIIFHLDTAVDVLVGLLRLVGNLFARRAPAAVLGTDDGARRGRIESREPVANGTVAIYGDTFPLEDWSPSGFLVSSCDLERKQGDEVPIHLSVPLPHKWLEVDCFCLVVRVAQAPGELAGMFVMMDKGAHEEIAQHFRYRPPPMPQRW